MCIFGGPKPPPPVQRPEVIPPPQIVQAPPPQVVQNTTEVIRQEVPSPAKVVHPAGTVDDLNKEEGFGRTKAKQRTGFNKFKIPLNEEAKASLTAPVIYPTSGLNIPT